MRKAPTPRNSPSYCDLLFMSSPPHLNPYGEECTGPECERFCGLPREAYPENPHPQHSWDWAISIYTHTYLPDPSQISPLCQTPANPT